MTALELLLRGRSESIPAADLTPAVRAELGQLRDDEILELERGAYRANCIALYSCYGLPIPLARSLTSKRDDPLTRTGNPADI